MFCNSKKKLTLNDTRTKTKTFSSTKVEQFQNLTQVLTTLSRVKLLFTSTWVIKTNDTGKSQK